MQKDFQTWHHKKSQIHDTGQRVYFHEREIWWCRIGLNVGFEQDGKGKNFARPVVIFRKFNNEVAWVLLFTTKVKTGKFYLPIKLGDGTPRVIVLSQLRLVDVKRLYQKIDVLSGGDYETLIAAVVGLCAGK